MKFEQSIKELEEIVKKMESEEVTIDESLELFTKGIKLCQECQETLKEAKSKIVLLKKESSQLIETQLEDENE